MRVTTSTLDTLVPATLALQRKEAALGSPTSSNYATFRPFSDGSPGASSKPDFDQARLWRATVPWVASAVDYMRDAATNAPRAIVQKDATVPLSSAEQATMDDIDRLLNAPDPSGGNEWWGSMVGPVVDDIYIAGRGAILKLFDEGELVQRLRTLDGARVTYNRKWDPDWEEKGEDETNRYWYMDTGSSISGKPLMNDDLVLITPTHVSYQYDGLSPMMYLRQFLLAHQDTFRGIHRVQRNKIPSGVFKMPGARKQTVENLTSMWDDKLVGRYGVAFMAIPAESEFIPIGDTNLVSQGAFSFMDILIRGVAAAFRISTLRLGWTQDVNRSTAAEQGENDDEGVINLLRLIQGFINREIVSAFPYSDNLQFSFTQLPAESEAEAVDVIVAKSGGHLIPWSMKSLMQAAGLQTPDEDDLSEAQKAFYSDPVWITNAGPVPLSLVAENPEMIAPAGLTLRLPWAPETLIERTPPTPAAAPEAPPESTEATGPATQATSNGNGAAASTSLGALSAVKTRALATKASDPGEKEAKDAAKTFAEEIDAEVAKRMDEARKKAKDAAKS